MSFNISGYRGIAVSGLEFSGVFQPNTQNTYSYIANKNFNLVRIPFSWDEMQPDLYGAFDPVELQYLQDNVGFAEFSGLNAILDMHAFGRRFVRADGGITEPFTASTEANLLLPYSDYTADGSITLRQYGQGLLGTFNNPITPATGYTVTTVFKFDSRDDTFGGEGLFIKPMWQDDNNCYSFAADLADNTWRIMTIKNGVSTTLASGSKTWGTSTHWTVVLDVNQGTNGFINGTLGGVALWTNNSIASDPALVKGKVAFMPSGVHVKLYGNLVLNVNGDVTVGNSTEYRVTDPQLPIAAWNDFWTKFSAVFQNNDTVLGYDHNEAHDMPIPTSPINYSQEIADENGVPLATNTYIIQQMLNSVRANGDNKYIVAEYDSYAGAQNQVALYTANPEPWIVDSLPTPKVIYSVHYYPDVDHSGSFTDPTVRTIASVIAEITPPFSWAASKGVPMLLGETGVPATTVWQPVLEQIYDSADSFGVWVAYWAGGDAYSSITTIQPTSNFTVDKLQMAVVGDHLGSLPLVPPVTGHPMWTRDRTYPTKWNSPNSHDTGNGGSPIGLLLALTYS